MLTITQYFNIAKEETKKTKKTKKKTKTKLYSLQTPKQKTKTKTKTFSTLFFIFKMQGENIANRC